MGGCYSWQILRQNVSWFLLKHKKTFNRRGFILKPSERTQTPPKIGTRNFWVQSTDI